MHFFSAIVPLSCAVAVVILSAIPAEGGFLRAGTAVNTTDVESSLLAELAGNYKTNSTSQRMSLLEKALEPLYTAMPKEKDGTLSHTVVRYMLHRFFAQRHGWFVKGLEPEGDARNASSAAALQEWVPSYLQNFLEELVGGRGLYLKDLAVLAATLEDLIHKEAEQRLKTAYAALELPLDGQIADQDQVQQVLQVYMMIYLLAGNWSGTDAQRTKEDLKLFSAQAKGWSEVQEWLNDLQASSQPASTFDQVLQLVYETAERYGVLNDRECGRLKSELLSIEAKKVGRVRLPEFYKHGLKGVWDFNENSDYLRAIGALDESDPKHPHVIVPNYVGSRPNCLISSEFYVVCCRNECEDLMASLELRVGGPTAEPDEIARAVVQIASASVAAPWEITDLLRQRLREIANTNGGRVPLHGRLFAQWMHHAYPRECPYPHIAGTTSPQTPDEWMQDSGHKSSSLTEEEMREHVESDTCALKPGTMEPSPECAGAHDTELPWNQVEELLHPASSESMPAATNTRKASHRSATRILWAGVRAVCIVTMLVALAFGVIWVSSPKQAKDKSDCAKSFDFCHQA